MYTLKVPAQDILVASNLKMWTWAASFKSNTSLIEVPMAIGKFRQSMTIFSNACSTKCKLKKRFEVMTLIIMSE